MTPVQRLVASNRSHHRSAVDGQEPPPVRALIHSIYFEKYGALNGVSALHLEDLLAGVAMPRPAWV